MNDNILELWPELEWISDKGLREKVAATWELALEKSTLTMDDLDSIPFTLLIPGTKVSFMAHKRSVVHIARNAARSILEFYGDELPLDLDVLIAGAILADVGKLLEYEIRDGGLSPGKVRPVPAASLLRCFPGRAMRDPARSLPHHRLSCR